MFVRRAKASLLTTASKLRGHLRPGGGISVTTQCSLAHRHVLQAALKTGLGTVSVGVSPSLTENKEWQKIYWSYES